jgi:hypothetical protein
MLPILLLALGQTADPPPVRYDPYRLDSYADAYRAVQSGRSVWIAVGVPDPWAGGYLAHLSVPSGSISGFADGLYRGRLHAGQPVMVPCDAAGREVPAAPSQPVATLPAARSVSYDPQSRCYRDQNGNWVCPKTVTTNPYHK